MKLLQSITLLLFALTILTFNTIAQDNIIEVPEARLYKEKKTALDYLGQESTITRFGKISDKIWEYAELGLQEFKSSALLKATLEEEGFEIESNVAGMPTCFIASWGEGKPVIGILGEYDALPMLSQKGRVPTQDPIIKGAPGHGCGHNMMGTAAAASVIAVKKSMEEHNIKGTIKFFGSPAEETVISRPYMVRAGVFDDVDAVIDNHASTRMGTGYGVSGNALISVIFTFKGETAHSAGAPWAGRSALDAVEIMNISANYLREHLHYTHRLHYIVMEGGEAPNVVPDNASVWYYVRNTDERIEDMYERVVNCARAAALATDTELEEIRVLTGIHQRHSNRGMAEAIQSNIRLIGMPEWTEEEQEFARALQKELGDGEKDDGEQDEEEKGFPEEVSSLKKPSGIQVGGGSSDVGEVTLVAPTATLRFPGGVPGMTGHHWSAVSAYYGSAAWKGLNTGARVMAATAVDLLTDKKKLESIQEEFEEYSREHPYKSLLPEDAEPPLYLNKELMDKYGPLMEGRE